MHEEELALKEAERAEGEKQSEERKQEFAALEERFKQSEEFVHKENVKVYRNVQAVVVDELKRQTESLSMENQALSAKQNTVLIISIFAMLFSVAGIVLQILSGLHILPF